MSLFVHVCKMVVFWKWSNLTDLVIIVSFLLANREAKDTKDMRERERSFG